MDGAADERQQQEDSTSKDPESPEVQAQARIRNLEDSLFTLQSQLQLLQSASTGAQHKSAGRPTWRRQGQRPLSQPPLEPGPTGHADLNKRASLPAGLVDTSPECPSEPREAVRVPPALRLFPGAAGTPSEANGPCPGPSPPPEQGPSQGPTASEGGVGEAKGGSVVKVVWEGLRATEDCATEATGPELEAKVEEMVLEAIGDRQEASCAELPSWVKEDAGKKGPEEDAGADMSPVRERGRSEDSLEPERRGGEGTLRTERKAVEEAAPATGKAVEGPLRAEREGGEEPLQVEQKGDEEEPEAAEEPLVTERKGGEESLEAERAGEAPLEAEKGGGEASPEAERTEGEGPLEAEGPGGEGPLEAEGTGGEGPLEAEKTQVVEEELSPEEQRESGRGQECQAEEGSEAESRPEEEGPQPQEKQEGSLEEESVRPQMPAEGQGPSGDATPLLAETPAPEQPAECQPLLAVEGPGANPSARPVPTYAPARQPEPPAPPEGGEASGPKQKTCQCCVVM
ncbi:paralemmin-3 [Crocuta crocuta]